MSPDATEVHDVIAHAIEYAITVRQPDGHWYGEMQSNSTITAEYIFMMIALGIDISQNRAELKKWLLADQNPDGSFSLGYGLPGDISTTAETYLALRILGLSSRSKALKRARISILRTGGLAKVRVFTRIFFAIFGLWPWEAVPQLPAELILLPSWFPIGIYRMSSWARLSVVPLLVIAHHQPIFPIPDVENAEEFLDELWVNPDTKNVPYSKSLSDLWHLFGLFSWELLFALVDFGLIFFGQLLRNSPLRGYAVAKCMEWTLKREEDSGDWGGIFPPLINSLIALRCEGCTPNDDSVKRGLKAMERFVWRDSKGMRIQTGMSPVWDTILMSIGLCDADISCKHLTATAMSWVEKRQILDPEKGDWREYRPHVKPGGWAFEYDNTWYPDIDDTAAAIIAFVKQDPTSCSSPHVLAALDWVLGMQSADGGWAAFDADNTSLFLEKIPFSDMGALCDPSTADVTGRVLEALGIVSYKGNDQLNPIVIARLDAATRRAIKFLRAVQERSGCWWGRWGVNYLYGTSNVLCGLAYINRPRHQNMIEPAVRWLKNCQHADGGWGEALQTYTSGEQMTEGRSTPSQTAWALMGLLAHLPATDGAIAKGVSFLLDTQITDKDGGTWNEPQYTGTGFPSHFYIRYDFYRHYFPLMALGRYRQAVMKEMRAGEARIE